MIIVENVLILNKTSSRIHVYHVLIRRYSALTLMTVHVSVHNGTLLADHFLDPHSIPRVLYSTNQFLIDIWVLVTMF